MSGEPEGGGERRVEEANSREVRMVKRNRAEELMKVEEKSFT